MKDDIKLIPIESSHLELIRNWRNSPEVSAYMFTSNFITPEDQLKWFEKIKNDQSSRHWIIEYNGKLLGVAALADISSLFNSCFWGFYLGDTSIRGAGIGSKVEYNLIQYVFEELKLNKMRCEVFAFNDKVVMMKEKFGFRREGYYRQHIKKDGVYKDVVGLALLKEEWDILKPALTKKIYGE